MACGGFEFDHDMQAQYLPGWPVFGHGSPGNTGDDFGRAASALNALSTAPYYALPVYPLMYNTQGWR